MAQTPDGYLWLGGEFGLFRFDGVRFTRWQPPAGQQLPDRPYSLLVTRDGTLWIGTFAGLVSWNGDKLTQYPQLNGLFVTSLLEDREGTVWAGTLGTPTGRLCAIRSGLAQCYGDDGAFGSFVWSLGEDSSGALWAGAEHGVWRWSPGPPRRYATPGMRMGDISKADDGRLLVGMSGCRTQSRSSATKSKRTRFIAQRIRMRCSRIAMSIRISCSATATEVSGSEPTGAGSSMYTTAGQTYLRKLTDSQETSVVAFSRIVKATSGSPPPQASTDFESSRSLIFPRNKVCPAIILTR